MKYFAVFGNPILHSKSPQMLNNVFQKSRFDGYYTRIWARSGNEVVKIIRDLNLSGANITSPFKETVIPHLNELSKDAENIEAVNTITNQGGVLKGYNTDPYGVTGALKETGINLKDKNCIVFGAGGAGKAAAYGLIAEEAIVTITNRTYSKANEIAVKFGCNSIHLDDAINNINDYDVIVMALLPGIWPIDNKKLKTGAVVLNSIYKKHNEGLNNENNYTLIDGHRWLLNHAAECSSYFTGKKPQISILEEGIKYELNPQQVKIELIKNNVFDLLSKKSIDLLIPSDNLNQQQIKQIINEEKKHAFS